MLSWLFAMIFFILFLYFLFYYFCWMFMQQQKTKTNEQWWAPTIIILFFVPLLFFAFRWFQWHRMSLNIADTAAHISFHAYIWLFRNFGVWDYYSAFSFHFFFCFLFFYFIFHDKFHLFKLKNSLIKSNYGNISLQTQYLCYTAIIACEKKNCFLIVCCFYFVLPSI